MRISYFPRLSVDPKIPMTITIFREPQEVSQTLTEPCNIAADEVTELTDFLSLIDKLPMGYRTDFYRTLNRLVEDFERRQRVLGYVQESLSQMNLDLKYLIFDLEATRRERDEYRRQLEELN